MKGQADYTKPKIRMITPDSYFGLGLSWSVVSANLKYTERLGPPVLTL
jgi:hypothetical protein